MQVRRRIAIHLAVVITTGLLLVVPLATSASATIFGPDGFGYIADDAAPGAFEDISGTGAAILTSTDDGDFTVPLGFTFPFYGGAFTDAVVCSNGNLSFLAAACSFVNTDLTTTPPIQPLVAPMWDDWVTNCSAADAVYVETRGIPGVDLRFIAQWDVFGFADCGDPYSFQVALFENGSIEFRYADVNGSQITRDFGGEATVGITGGSGGGAPGNGFVLQTSFNSPVLSDGQVICFSIGGAGCPAVQMRRLDVQVSGLGRVVGPGIDCPGDCTELFGGGATVTLDAISALPAFWGGDCSGFTTTCDVVMDQDRSVLALFGSGGGGGDGGGGGGGGRAGVNVTLNSNQDVTTAAQKTTLADNLVLKGRVRSPRAVCTANVEVELRRDGGRLLTTTVTGDDGKFRFGPFVMKDPGRFLDVVAHVDRTGKCKAARSGAVTVPTFRIP